MGDIQTHRPVLRFMAVFSRYHEAIEWARERAAAAWGPIALESPLFAFEETAFYEQTMGQTLQKMLCVFAPLADPGELAVWKHQTNAWEEQFAQSFPCEETRPLNLDPGYVTEAKLVLASTKDRDHRIYLSQGIFAENTLFYRSGEWQIRPWTYPNYRRPDYHQFLDRCREFYRLEKRKLGN